MKEASFPKWKEEFEQIILAEALLGLIWGICYREILWFLPLQIFLPFLLRYFRKFQQNKRKTQLKQGFLDLLQSLMTSLQAGYTLENACLKSLEELQKRYQKNSPIVESFYPVVSGIQLRIPLASLFYQFAGETEVEEIRQFATIIEISQGMGGNTVEIIRTAMQQLRESLEKEAEVRILLSGKIYEKNIMLVMPFAFLLYLSLVNPSYVRMFYETMAGHIIMSFLLAGVYACFLWTEKIMEGCQNA